MTHLETQVGTRTHTHAGTYLVRHGGGEQHGLSVVGTHPNDLLHLFLKVLIQHPEKQNQTGDTFLFHQSSLRVGTEPSIKFEPVLCVLRAKEPDLCQECWFHSATNSLLV